MRIVTVVSSLAILGQLGLSDALAQPAAFIAACEAALKASLRAPSTYRRLSIIDSTRRISLDEYLATEPSPTVRAFQKRMGGAPVRTAAIIEYDAANAAGVALRSHVECSYDTLDGDASRATAAIVKLDGKTQTDRIVDSVKRLHSH